MAAAAGLHVKLAVVFLIGHSFGWLCSDQKITVTAGGSPQQGLEITALAYHHKASGLTNSSTPDSLTTDPLTQEMPVTVLWSKGVCNSVKP
jgi:hypothetical protein